MALYTDESRDRVREAVDMIDLVGSRVELRRAGVNRLTGLCPFHDERSPSFGIDPVQKLYHCFGCGEGGDAFKFVMETEGVDFKGALELLADRYNVTLEQAEEDPKSAERRRRRERLLELLERTAAYYVRLLWESPEAAEARSYLAGRGLEEGVLREFRVGFAPPAWDRVLLASRKAGFGDRDLHDAGLVRRGQGGRINDAFRAQIIFPLTDARGRVLGFAGRTLDPDDRRPKYLNSADGELFHKRRQLFGADLARASAAKAASVVLAEGYTDVIALHQAGLRNAVATMGTSLTEEQVAELARLAPVVHMALDSDNAGQEAIVRAARVAAGRRLELRVVELPAGEDPADLVARAGGAEMERRVAASVPFVRFRVQRALATGDLSRAEGKDRVLAELRGVLAPLRQGAERYELLRMVAERLDLRSPELVEPLLAGGAQAGGGASRAGSGAPGLGGGERRDRARGGDPTGGRDGAGRATREGGEPSAPALVRGPQPDRREGTEREFLALCIALPEAGGPALAELDIDADLTAPASRRLARHLRDHLGTPVEDLPDGDPELTALVRELSVRAARAEATPTALRIERVQLGLARLEREITTASRAGEGDVAALAARRTDLQAELGELMGD